MNKITCEMINIDKCYYMKTINSTAESYFRSCRLPCTSQCMLELQVFSVTTDTGTARYRTETFANHLRKTHTYNQQTKCYLLRKSPVHVLRYCELEIPVTINVTGFGKCA